MDDVAGQPAAEELVRAALAGDRDSWEAIVARYKNVAWKVISTFDLSAEDRNDVFAGTFFRLCDRLGTIRDPERLPGWIATTARNEALTLLRHRQREAPRAVLEEAQDPDPDLAAGMLSAELQVALRAALEDLDPSTRDLLQLFLAEPPLSYDAIAELTNRPRGSLGPTRQRCLERLRRSPHLTPFLEDLR